MKYITLRDKPELEKTAAEWFNEKWHVPQEAYLRCMDAYLNNETEYGWYFCLIIGGTSLEVGSAAQLAHMYHGRYLIIINKGKTKLEGKADLVFHDSIGKILEQID